MIVEDFPKEQPGDFKEDLYKGIMNGEGEREQNRKSRTEKERGTESEGCEEQRRRKEGIFQFAYS